MQPAGRPRERSCRGGHLAADLKSALFFAFRVRATISCAFRWRLPHRLRSCICSLWPRVQLRVIVEFSVSDAHHHRGAALAGSARARLPDPPWDPARPWRCRRLALDFLRRRPIMAIARPVAGASLRTALDPPAPPRSPSTRSGPTPAVALVSRDDRATLIDAIKRSYRASVYESGNSLRACPRY
jgi:hypothetical protein